MTLTVSLRTNDCSTSSIVSSSSCEQRKWQKQRPSWNLSWGPMGHHLRAQFWQRSCRCHLQDAWFWRGVGRKMLWLWAWERSYLAGRCDLPGQWIWPGGLWTPPMGRTQLWHLWRCRCALLLSHTATKISGWDCNIQLQRLILLCRIWTNRYVDCNLSSVSEIKHRNIQCMMSFLSYLLYTQYLRTCNNHDYICRLKLVSGVPT